ncbi:MAG: NAD(P)-dependent oxidoreductase [Gammaproteobacteria bacterium CG_4_10_14_0_8_um_filter_38_16]|nr:MAG: NAD(P)-dependent oxidoreductase [Gammaproteobacteria bacterium CG_4_10_14_0_8_um_filter_38_16]PJA02963.1 MAG: NAD(P)-dependent oxidoreductase [Gammaproteobacteria bacterium CG_4_10_14_0_2_um_filter_38_22]PJB11445.1 MAG: NAD(P)-dependent oxidoreductase [Gammaproteobacteria bacterium CG_4_9_14_3_um_filter_38_9]
MLRNKIVLITGASSGIGEACAHGFAKAGATLILSARRIDIIQKLAEQLKQRYQTEVQCVELDVRDHAQIKKQLSTLPENLKHIDVLINNAGLAAGLSSVQEGDVTDWETMIDTNIKGLLYMTREILPGMVAREEGHIINIGSISGHTVYPNGVVYCATKHAVKALSQGLRMDLLGTKIRVSSVDPGAVETNFSLVRYKGDVERARKVYEGFDPLRAQDIAEAVLFCATRPPHVNVSEMIVMPTDQAAVHMIARK